MELTLLISAVVVLSSALLTLWRLHRQLQKSIAATEAALEHIRRMNAGPGYHVTAKFGVVGHDDLPPPMNWPYPRKN